MTADQSLLNFTPGGVAFAFSLTLIAGLATGLGSAIAFFTKRNNLRVLALSLAFSAGVMLYISFIEILPKATESLARTYGEGKAAWLSNTGFFVGIIFMAIIDALIPKAENPHEVRGEAELQQVKAAGRGEAAAAGATVEHRGLWRMGMFTALAIAIHNFPEGMVGQRRTVDRARNAHDRADPAGEHGFVQQELQDVDRALRVAEQYHALVVPQARGAQGVGDLGSVVRSARPAADRDHLDPESAARQSRDLPSEQLLISYQP